MRSKKAGTVAAPKLRKPREVKGFSRKTRRKSRLTLPVKLQEYLDKQGLAARWVSYRDLIDNDGFHHNEWQAFEVPDKELVDNITMNTGVTANKYLRRGDLILGVRPKHLDEEYRRELAYTARSYTTDGMIAQAKEELEAMAGQANVSSVVRNDVSEYDD